MAGTIYGPAVCGIVSLGAEPIETTTRITL